MSFRLRDGLSFCICGERIVLLDLESDRYFCLGPHLELAFKRWAAKAERENERDVGLLWEHGFLVPAPQGPWPAIDLRVPRATSDLLVASKSPSLVDVLRVIAAELKTAIRLRRRPLIEIVERCRSNWPQSKSTDERITSRAERLAAAFERSALLLGATDRCLTRALAAMIVCHRCRVYPTLVFGVRINPFAAHCWVQLDNSVLVGDFEQVRLFTPILAVQ